MDKALKFLKKLWLFKERLVLVILLGFLGYRFYMIFVPTIADAGETVAAGPPPVAPIPEPRRLDAKGQFRGLVQRGPFSYHTDTALGDTTDLTGEQVGIKLIDIKRGLGGKWRARLKTKSSKWFDEGENFETFVLEEIDPDAKTVVIYATEYAKSIKLSLDK